MKTKKAASKRPGRILSVDSCSGMSDPDTQVFEAITNSRHFVIDALYCHLGHR